MAYLYPDHSSGYVRVILAVASLYYMPLHPRTCSFLYSVSCLLDALDGYLARRFNQSTTFGSVLDMVTDRCTTACLLVFLSSAWPRWSILFQGLISLDLSSHYMHMYATLSRGGADQSHKKVDSSRSWILHQYYTNRVCCQPAPAYMRQTNSSRFRIDRPVCLLCPERAVLHRPVPAVVFLPNVVAVPSAAALRFPEPAPSATSADAVCQSVQRRSPGARSGQQD